MPLHHACNIYCMRTAERIEHNSYPEPHVLAKMCVDAADDKKASDIITLDVSKLTSYTDMFVICSAPSERQVQAIVSNVVDVLREQGVRPLGVEGMGTSAWVLLDLGSVIFHCFSDSAREYYDLEGLWIDAERVNF